MLRKQRSGQREKEGAALGRFLPAAFVFISLPLFLPGGAGSASRFSSPRANEVAHCSHFRLKVHFYIALKDYNRSPFRASEIRERLKVALRLAESLYGRRPGLTILPRFVYVDPDKISAPDSFAAGADLRRFMLRFFRAHRRPGSFPVLVLSDLKRGNRRIGGALNGGIALSYARLLRDPSVLAHELGHLAGLRHTFSRKHRADLCRDFPLTKGGTRSGKWVNLMDYGRAGVARVRLEDCQQEKVRIWRINRLQADCRAHL